MILPAFLPSERISASTCSFQITMKPTRNSMQKCKIYYISYPLIIIISSYRVHITMVNLSLILSRVVLMLYLLTLKNFVKYEYLIKCEYSYIKYLRIVSREKTASRDLIGFRKPITPPETIIFLKKCFLKAFGGT